MRKERPTNAFDDGAHAAAGANRDLRRMLQACSRRLRLMMRRQATCDVMAFDAGRAGLVDRCIRCGGRRRPRPDDPPGSACDCSIGSPPR